MTTHTNSPAYERTTSAAPEGSGPPNGGLVRSVDAAINEIRACIDERERMPTTLARRRLAAHHAAARLRRRIGDDVQP